VTQYRIPKLRRFNLSSAIKARTEGTRFEADARGCEQRLPEFREGHPSRMNPTSYRKAELVQRLREALAATVLAS
jgi:hypothetical protein